MTESYIADDDLRYRVVKWGSRWRCEDVLNHNDKDAPTFPSEHLADVFCVRKNTQHRKAMRR